MANTVFEKLGYNFDDSLYGINFEISEEGKKTLKTQAENITLEPWQIADIATGDAATKSNYYKNPHAAVCSTLRATANSIKTIANTYTFSNISSTIVLTSATNCVIEIDKFKTHTDNISGVADSTTFRNADAYTIPTLDTASSLGQGLISLVNKTDAVENASPMMGSLTSLFIGPYLASNNTILASDYEILNTTLSVTSTDDGQGGTITTYTSNMSSDAANTMVLHLDNLTTLLNTRRTHDWNFFRQGNQVLKDYYQMKKLGSMGRVEANLVINLIGTDRLTANLTSG